jgi:UPF0716 protein FxsA
MILIGLSLIVLAEIFFIEFVGELWGIYFTLAVAALTGLAGLFFSYREISTRITIIRDGVSEGVYPEKEFIQLAGAIVVGLLLLMPGFVTDFIGAIGFFPVIRGLYGKIITARMGNRLNELYEYLKLYD